MNRNFERRLDEVERKSATQHPTITRIEHHIIEPGNPKPVEILIYEIGAGSSFPGVKAGQGRGDHREGRSDA